LSRPFAFSCWGRATQSQGRSRAWPGASPKTPARSPRCGEGGSWGKQGSPTPLTSSRPCPACRRRRRHPASPEPRRRSPRW
jgi:hypothetical protein